MYVEDTIVAPATPAGTGAVAIVRLSGPRTVEILRSMWRPLTNDKLEPRRLYLGDIIDPKTHAHIDRAMAVFFPHPHSLTGEDVAELQCHGGSYVVRRITELTMHLGARMAEPGEFTRRSFLNGRIDLTEAEGVADLVNARGESALKQAISHLTGSLAEKMTGLWRSLISNRPLLWVDLVFLAGGIQIRSG